MVRLKATVEIYRNEGRNSPIEKLAEASGIIDSQSVPLIIWELDDIPSVESVGAYTPSWADMGSFRKKLQLVANCKNEIQILVYYEMENDIKEVETFQDILAKIPNLQELLEEPLLDNF
jgi:hypothetical protein